MCHVALQRQVDFSIGGKTDRAEVRGVAAGSQARPVHFLLMLSHPHPLPLHPSPHPDALLASS